MRPAFFLAALLFIPVYFTIVLLRDVIQKRETRSFNLAGFAIIIGFLLVVAFFLYITTHYKKIGG